MDKKEVLTLLSLGLILSIMTVLVRNPNITGKVVEDCGVSDTTELFLLEADVPDSMMISEEINAVDTGIDYFFEEAIQSTSQTIWFNDSQSILLQHNLYENEDDAHTMFVIFNTQHTYELLFTDSSKGDETFCLTSPDFFDKNGKYYFFCVFREDNLVVSIEAEILKNDLSIAKSYMNKVYNKIDVCEDIVVENSCYDSDGGTVFGKKGISTGLPSKTLEGNYTENETISLTDYCRSSATLIEYYCQGNKINYSVKDCGVLLECIDGECIRKNVELEHEYVDEADQTSQEEPIKGLCPPDKILICKREKTETNICISPESVEYHLERYDYLGKCVEEEVEVLDVDVILANKLNNINVEDNHVKSLQIKTKEKYRNLEILLRTRKQPPQGVSKHKRKVSSYLVVDHPDIEDEDIIESYIEFKVEDSWLKENGLSVENVVLTKFVNYIWVDLETEYVKTIGDYHYFKGNTNSFSTFAITLDPEKKLQGQAEEEIETETETEELPEEYFEQPEQGLLEGRLERRNKILFGSVFLISFILLIIFFKKSLDFKKKKKTEKETQEKKESVEYQYGNIVDYVKEQREKGRSDEQIRKELKEDTKLTSSAIERIMLK